MARQKAALHEHEIAVRLSDKEYKLLQAFAAEHDIQDFNLAIPKLIHEYINLSDRLWDAELAQSPEMLKKNGTKSHA